MCVKRCSNIFIGLKKKDLYGCFRIEEIRDQDNEVGLKEGREVEIETTVLFHIRDACSPFAFYIYLPSKESATPPPLDPASLFRILVSFKIKEDRLTRIAPPSYVAMFPSNVDFNTCTVESSM